MYKTEWCSDCRLPETFFEQFGIKVEKIDIDENREAAFEMERLNNGNKIIPTILVKYEDGSEKVLLEPSWAELEETFKQEL